MNERVQRVALITGATGGLGVPVTQAFLAAGYAVVAVARSHDVPLEQENLYHLSADVTDRQSVERAVEQAVERAGRVDLGIHLVGSFVGGQSVAETTQDVWRTMMSVNAESAFLLFRTLLPHLRAQRWGRLLAIGARAASTAPATLSAYAASKAALEALVKVTANELAGSGVTANAIAPGIIDTPANRTAMPQADVRTWVTPQAIAEALLWLASDASAAVNGLVLPL